MQRELLKDIDLSHPVFEAVKEAARQLQVETYVVGGYVRDQLLGRPCKDIDFVCVGEGTALAKAVAALLSPDIQVVVYKNFGTANFKWAGMDIEFVGARKESYRSDSRKPIVEQGSLMDDQYRRDFTINALAISLNQENYGQIVDSFGGLKDLENKIIRTPLDPDVTFS
ncbi:MAG: tRNA nucleotidyltransferase, partial [Chitinophagales bacterium]|nr:tRNA nucleotidyltransferase [Chitinophagales bacterium]